MPDNLKNRGPADAKRVNVNESWELRYWKRRFRCTEAALREAVHTVGPRAADVSKFLDNPKDRPLIG